MILLAFAYSMGQVLLLAIHLTPIVFICRWNRHAYIQRLSPSSLVFRGILMAVACSALLHTLPVWDPLWSSGGLLDCFTFWVIAHVTFYIGLMFDIFGMFHAWLIYFIDYLQSSTASITWDQHYRDISTIIKAVSTDNGLDDTHAPAASSHHESAAVANPLRSYRLSPIRTLLARISFWIYIVPGVELVKTSDGHWLIQPALTTTSHFPTITTGLRLTTRAKLTLFLTWILVLSVSMSTMYFMTGKLIPTHSDSHCSGDELFGLPLLTGVASTFALLVYCATYRHKRGYSSEMVLLRKTLGWKVGTFAILAGCYFPAWLRAQIFEPSNKRFGPWIFPLVWDTVAGATRGWFPVLIVWSQLRRDERHWANLPETRLRKLLSDSKTLPAFVEFCTKQHCSEGLQFHLDYESLIISSPLQSNGSGESEGPNGGSSVGCNTHQHERQRHHNHRRQSLLSIATNSRNRTATRRNSSAFSFGIGDNSSSLLFGRYGTILSRSRASRTTTNRSSAGPLPHPSSPADSQAPSSTASDAVTVDALVTNPTMPIPKPATAVIAPFIAPSDPIHVDSFHASDPFAPAQLVVVPLPSDPLVLRLQYFANQYIAQGSPRELNISALNRQRFLQAIADGNLSTDALVALDDVAKHTFRLMLDGVFLRFSELQQLQQQKSQEKRARRYCRWCGCKGARRKKVEEKHGPGSEAGNMAQVRNQGGARATGELVDSLVTNSPVSIQRERVKDTSFL